MAVRLLLLALLLGGNPSFAAEHAEQRFADRFVAQYAGHLGLVALGVEHISGPRSSFHFLAGYAPASVEGVDIYMAAIKGNYYFVPLLISDEAIVRPYAGLGLHYYFGGQYHVRDYPEGYYTHPATEWHLMPYLGIKLTGNSAPHRDITIYAEAGIIDAYLIHYYNNYQTIGLGDVVTFALGMSVPLR